MVAVYRYRGHVLRRNGLVATGPDCCCEESSSSSSLSASSASSRSSSSSASSLSASSISISMSSLSLSESSNLGCCEGRTTWPDYLYGSYTINCVDCTFDAPNPLDFFSTQPGPVEYLWNQDYDLSCGDSVGFAAFFLYCQDGVWKLDTTAFGRTNTDIVDVTSCDPFHATVDATVQWPVPGNPDDSCTITIEFTE